MNKNLVIAGTLSMLVAILHIAIIIGGSSWYITFGAGEEMATMAEQGSWLPGIMTFGIAIVFFIWGLYAFSAAGIIRKLPFMKTALVLISLVYLGRGFAFFPLALFMPDHIDNLIIWSSLISALIGAAYAIGTKQVWSNL